MRLKDGKQAWAHQDTMTEFSLTHPLALINGGVGVGKTLAALRVAELKEYQRVLVLTVKAAMRSVWAEAIDEFYEDVVVLVLDKGTTVNKWDQINTAMVSHRLPLIVVVNYESAKDIPLGLWDWDFVIADESHKLKSHNSAVSNTLAVALKNVEHKLAMTGTPWADRPTDVFGQMRFLDPKKNGKTWGAAALGSWTAFFDYYVNYRTQDNIKIPISYIHQDLLAERLAPYVLMVDRDKVLTLPGIVHVTRHAYLSAGHRKAYDTLKKEMVVDIGEDTIMADNVLVLGLRLHQLAGGFYGSGLGSEAIVNGEAKLDTLLGIVDELGDEPFVVFTRFQEDVIRIATALAARNVKCCFLTGQQDSHMMWRQGKGQALIANIQAGSAGINLTRAAYVIFYSTGFSNTDYQQALGRLDRPGQTRKVTAFHVVAKDTIDEVILARLGAKNKEAATLEGRLK